MTAHVVFTLADTSYALALTETIEVLPAALAAPLPGAPALVAGVLDVRGELIPMVDLRMRLGLPARELGLEDHLIVARAGRRIIAFPVEQADGVVDLDPDTTSAAGPAVVTELAALFGAAEALDLDRALAKARS